MTNQSLLKVEVGTRKMRQIFHEGVENYQPTLGGHDLLEEGGVTNNSIKNLAAICEALGIKPTIMEFGPNMTVYFRFSGLGLDNYVATGFGWGYPGTAPASLAIVISSIYPSQRSDAVDRIRRGLEARPQDMVGLWDPDQAADPWDGLKSGEP